MRRSEAYGLAGIFVLCWLVVTAPFRMVWWLFTSAAVFKVMAVLVVLLLIAGLFQ